MCEFCLYSVKLGLIEGFGGKEVREEVVGGSSGANFIIKSPYTSVKAAHRICLG
jgi:hypothetical protein